MAARSFPAPNRNIATHIGRFSSTSQVTKKTKGAGFGVVNGIVYINETGTAQAMFDTATLAAGTLATVTGLTVAESGSMVHRTIFTFTAVALTLLDATVGLGTKIYDFPKGNLLILNSAGQVAETTTSVLANTLNTGITYNWGVGTVTQANGTLATTEQDILPTTNGTASATISVAGATSKGVRVTAPTLFNGSATAKSAYFNVGIATATDIDGDATSLWTGSITIDWMINTAGN